VYKNLSLQDLFSEVAMGVLNSSDTRAKLQKVMDRVVADRAPVAMTRQKAVVVTLADWNAMEETMRLLFSAANA
jgi:antitoxin YefM